MSSRPRVLMLAYCCSPYHGSEEGLGWNVATEVAKVCDVTVITEQHKFGPSIRRYLDEQGPIPGLQFVFEPEKAWAHTMWKTPALGYLSYNWWHQRALQTARRLHEKTPFDLAHQLNIISFREPGYLHELGVPFVWGPVGGAQNYPTAFLSEAGWSGAWRERIRSWLNRWQLIRGGRKRKAAREATVIAANRENRAALKRLGARAPVIVSEVACQAAEGPTPLAPRSRDGVFRVLWSGIHTTRKALSLLIKAVARCEARDRIEVTVLGKGPETKRWRRLTERLGVADRFHWAGWLPHEEAKQAFLSADVFAFTSLRDTTGTVVVESLSRGLPVICLDHQGAGEVVTEQSGVKIPVTTPDQVAADLAATLYRLASDKDEVRRLSRGALDRATHFCPERLGMRVVAAYRRAAPTLDWSGQTTMENEFAAV